MRHYTLWLLTFALAMQFQLTAQEVNEIFEGQDTFYVLPSDLHYASFKADARTPDRDFPDGKYRQYLFAEDDSEETEEQSPVAYYEFHLLDNVLEHGFSHNTTAGHLLSQGAYAMGKQHGFWYEYQDTAAVLRTKTFYEYGANMQMFFYNPEGLLLRRDIHFHETDMTEKVLTTWFHPNGHLARQGITIVQVSGEQLAAKDGQWRTWYTDGSPRALEYYEDGEYTGRCKYFREDGQLDRVSIFRKGKLKEEIEYQYPVEETESILALYKDKNGKVRRSVEL